MAKNTGKVREFCQSRRVGTLDMTDARIFALCNVLSDSGVVTREMDTGVLFAKFTIDEIKNIEKKTR